VTISERIETRAMQERARVLRRISAEHLRHLARPGVVSLKMPGGRLHRILAELSAGGLAELSAGERRGPLPDCAGCARESPR
jgi:hypothetical protein